MTRYIRLGDTPQWKKLEELEKEREVEVSNLYKARSPLVAMYSIGVRSDRLTEIDQSIEELNSELYSAIYSGTIKCKNSDNVRTTIIPPIFWS